MAELRAYDGAGQGDGIACAPACAVDSVDANDGPRGPGRKGPGEVLGDIALNEELTQHDGRVEKGGRTNGPSPCAEQRRAKAVCAVGRDEDGGDHHGLVGGIQGQAEERMCAGGEKVG